MGINKIGANQNIKKIIIATPSRIKPKLVMIICTDFFVVEIRLNDVMATENRLATANSAEPATKAKNKRSAIVKPVCITGSVELCKIEPCHKNENG